MYVIECQTPYAYVGSSCLYLETDPYKKANWTDARETCITLGGDLAILDTETKHQDAEQLVMMHYDIFANEGTVWIHWYRN